VDIEWSLGGLITLFRRLFKFPAKKFDIINHMSTQDWAAFILTILSITAIVGVGVRWIIKTYVNQIIDELKPNSGSSMKDQITRLEDRVNEADILRRNMDDKLDKVYYLLIDHIAEMNKKKSKSKI
jgi:hypothetical protein